MLLYNIVYKRWLRLIDLIPTDLKERLMANAIFGILHGFIFYSIFGVLFIPTSLRGNGVLISPKDKVWIFVPPPPVTFSFVEIFRLHIYEQVFKVEKGETVIDVGAHVGIIHYKSSKKGREGR